MSSHKNSPHLHICAEVMYEKEGVGGIHSDLCAEWDGTPASDSEWRKLLHDSLDEYLDNMVDPESQGIFYVGDADNVQKNSLGVLNEREEKQIAFRIEMMRKVNAKNDELERLRKIVAESEKQQDEE